MDRKSAPRILIVPLDWGLGHATRCIPVINAFLQNGCPVILAGDNVAKEILMSEFPQLHFLPLAGYRIHYTVSKRMLPFKILYQIPKIGSAIRREHHWLEKIVTEYKIDAVVSDNRYGLFHTKIPSVFITHQLQIQTPLRWLTALVQKINYRFLNRFSECWVPDFGGGMNMAGDLSHPLKLPLVPVKYLGALARFVQKEEAEIKYKWLFVMSGPEPQRSLLEEKFMRILPLLDSPVLLVRGLPQNSEPLFSPPNGTIVNYLSTTNLNEAFLKSEYIVSRSGYTTVMEILSLQKKSVLIPTPGQTEQEFLARHLAKQQWCYTCPQDEDVLTHLQRAETFTYQLPQWPVASLTDVVSEFVFKIKYQKAGSQPKNG